MLCDVNQMGCVLDRWEIQESQYEFPYHYIPDIDKRGVGVRVRSLTWGLEYLCYMMHVQMLVYDLAPSSLLDVGCGDGRFIKLLGPRIKRRVGVDLSERAIGFAKAFNHDAEFVAGDAKELRESFDVVTAIEVLEHVPDADTGRFLRTLEERTIKEGFVVVSVPTTNAPANPKHYRHYDITLFGRELEESGAMLQIRKVDYVYRRSRLIQLYERLGDNRWWVAEVKPFRPIVWRYVWNKLREADETRGRHLVVVLKRTPA